MNKPRFSYLRVTAAMAILAVTSIPAIRQSTAKAHPPEVTLVDTDVSNEARIIAKYGDDLSAYHKEAQALGKRARLVSNDLNEVQNRSEDLKRRLSEVQNAIRETVRKLKASGEWNNLDTDILARITDSRDKAYFQQNSFKKILEDAGNGLSDYQSEISEPVENLRRKVATRMLLSDGALIVNAAYVPPAPFGKSPLQCLIKNVQVGLVWRVNGKESPFHQDTRICACSGGATCNSATT